jgi:septal ring factor EnvC (AmiA/AmiB activator)
MISNGVPEDVAKEVIATSQLRKELQAEKNQLEKEKKAREDKESKDKEYEDFINEFPDVKAEDIPKDVFLNAQNSSLTEAYIRYQNEELKKQIEIMKKNNSNASSSIGSTTEFGGKENKTSDPFLDGFDE